MGWHFRRLAELEEGEKIDIPQREVFKALLRFIKPYKFRVLLLAVAIFSGIFVNLAIPLVTKFLIDSILRADIFMLMIYSVIFLGVVSLNLMLSFSQSYLNSWIGQTLIHDIRNKMYWHLLRIKQRYFSGQDTGRLVSRLTNDVDTIGNAFTSGLIDTLANVFQLFSAIFIMFKLSIELSFIVLLLIPLILLSSWIFAKRARDAFRESRKKIAEVTSRIEQNVSGAKVVQAFSYRKKINIESFSKINRENLEINVQASKVVSSIGPTMGVIRALGIALILWYGGMLVSQGKLTIGTLVAFYGYVDMFFRPIQMITMFYNTLQSTLAAAERVVDFLRWEKEEDHGSIDKMPEKGEIEYKNVVFGYDERIPVIKGVSFRVRPGERVAIVGPTGSGKTTLVNLLLRFYDPWEGQILIDGIDIRKYKLDTLRKFIAFVPQEPILFDGTVYENMTLANSSISKEEVIRMLEYLGLKEIIDKLPKCLDTKILEGGKNISMGQRQVISYIRALIANPKILVLDEATSSLDLYTEEKLQKALEKISKGKTMIIIAHRLQTIINSDRIIVIHNGRIVEEGTHDELLEMKGLYARLYESQFAKITT
ncbi:MAG: antibiotic ABC transporter ATP-binding protein [Thermofilum sp. ex4484_79]|nr:MAG: antibiotic ABC transporter ATP-binding protein [Thermofilum sp. ex4484_79]